MTLKDLKQKIHIPSVKELEQQASWIQEQIEQIGIRNIQNLIQSAVDVRKNAYEPYSGYKVGAAILCKSENIHASCNAEVVTFTETDHAERSAITKAISEGEVKISGRKFIKAIVISHSGQSGPCGGCRQRIAQHCDNALIIDVDIDGNIQAISSLQILFPYAFIPSHLETE